MNTLINATLNPFVGILRRSSLLTQDLDYHAVRASMVIIFLFFGYQKWFEYEAQVLIPYISNGPLIWWMYPGDLLTRGGYSELFYPPTPGFIMTASGLAMMLLATIDWKPDLALYRPLRLLGESALLMYLLHIVLIKYVVAPEWEDESLETFIFLYAGMVLGLLVVAYAGRGIKSRWRHLPLPVRVLLGN